MQMDNKGYQPDPGASPPYPGQPYPGQPGQPYTGQPGQPYPGQPGQPYPGQPGQPYPGQPGHPYPGQPGASSTVVVVQNDRSRYVNSYLGFAIFTCLCCCWPIGIAAIIFAVRTNDENAKGNTEGAQSNSKVALWCSVAGLVFGSVWIIAVIALAATGRFAYGYSSYNPYYYG